MPHYAGDFSRTMVRGWGKTPVSGNDRSSPLPVAVDCAQADTAGAYKRRRYLAGHRNMFCVRGSQRIQELYKTE